MGRRESSIIGKPPENNADAEPKHGHVPDDVPLEHLWARLPGDHPEPAADPAGAKRTPQIVGNPYPEHDRENECPNLHDGELRESWSMAQ